jgi:hypothetical protein
MVIFVDVTKMYAMILIVSYMQPAGAIWLSFTFLWPTCYVYIQKIYCNGWRLSRPETQADRMIVAARL